MLLRRNLPVLALERYRRLAEPEPISGHFVQFFSRCQDGVVTPRTITTATSRRWPPRYPRERDALAG